MSSMTQDVVLRGAQDTELESITGSIVQLAAEHSVAVPYNRAIYRLGREKFHPASSRSRPSRFLRRLKRSARNFDPSRISSIFGRRSPFPGTFYAFMKPAPFRYVAARSSRKPWR